MKDFFVSYNQADRPWAEWIAWQLEDAGFSAIVQAWDFGAGADFVLQMQRAAEESDCTLAVLSPDYLAARFTQPEWTAAFSRDPTGEKGTLLPVRVRDCQPTGMLGTRAYLDLVALDEPAARLALLAGVQRSRAPLASVPPAPTAAAPSRAKPASPPPFPGTPGHRSGVVLPAPDALPEPGSLPLGSRLPFGRNALFTGRTQPLLALGRALVSARLPGQEPGGSAGPVLATQAVAGMGGVGKTQLAVEFAYRFGRFFQGVHWIQAALPSALPAEIAACGEAMQITPWPNEQPKQVRFTLDTWRAGGTRLVILDNLEDVAAAREWLPRLAAPSVRLLLTARRHDWPRDLGLHTIRLALFSPAESLGFLRQWLPAERAADEELAHLAERLGHLPLALQLAARYLDKVARLGVAQYLAGLDDVLADRAMAGWRSDLGDPTGHDLDLAATFYRSWQQVAEENARRVFLVAGYCAPNKPIPCEVLERSVGLQPEVCDEALGTLSGLGLVEMDDPQAGPTLHPLLAGFAQSMGRRREGEFGALAALAEALRGLSEEALGTQLPARFAPLRPHMEAAAPEVEAAGIESARALWNSLGTYLRVVAELPSARAALERALRIDEAAFGPDHLQVAEDANDLGVVLQYMGDLAGARAALDRAMQIVEVQLGPEHPNVATVAGNLGAVLYQVGDLAGARAVYERALRIDEAAYGPDDLGVAVDVSNLGVTLQAMGDRAGARAAYERALRIKETALGPDHPQVANTVSNLSSVLQSMGDLGGARAALERSLRIKEATYGPDHPSVGRDVSGMGSVLQSMGDLAGAREALERALRIDEAAFGQEHPEVARDLDRLGSVLHAQGDLAGARSALERALRILETMLPADHPSIRTVRGSLASLPPPVS